MDRPVLDYLNTLYTAGGGTGRLGHYASPTAQQAFREAAGIFASSLTGKAEKIELVEGATDIRAIQSIANDSFAKYSNELKYPRAKRWLHRLLSRIHHYANIMDVLAQHHPEYAALAWGAMKLILISAQNHEATIHHVSKALAQIADLLPRVELNTILYPTEYMRQAVGALYANLMQFFIRAHKWCNEGSARRALHSITRPPELRYVDLLRDIEQGSREIDQLAASGARVEIRDIHLKVSDMLARIGSIQGLQSSSLVDTNERLSDLQFSQIMGYISGSKLGDPMDAYRFNISLHRRQRRNRIFETTNKFWLSPKLQAWSAGPESKIVVMDGGFRARSAMRSFSMNILEQLRSKDVPVLWAFRGAGDSSAPARVSSIDVFKHLILQALRLEQDSMTEKKMSLQCARFHTATTEREWLQLLGSALVRARSQVYVVIDLSTVDNDLLSSDGFSWLAGFQQLFLDIAQKSPNVHIKVLLLGGVDTYRTHGPEQVPSNLVVPVRVTRPPVRRRKQRARSGVNYQHRDNDPHSFIGGYGLSCALEVTEFRE